MLNVRIFETKDDMATNAAREAAQVLKRAIAKQGKANIVTATGASQFELLESLTATEGIDWSKVVMFHLDEYIGLPIEHPASFRKYLMERIVDKVAPLKAYYLLEGDAEDVDAEIQKKSELIKQHPIDLLFAGIGENGHLAFNDPPADFETEEPYIKVELDDACRNQQYGEGWFDSFEDVPRQAISMSVQQIMSAKTVLCTVPDKRKAEAVHNCMEKNVIAKYPASILRRHPDCRFFFDQQAASMLSDSFHNKI